MTRDSHRVSLGIAPSTGVENSYSGSAVPTETLLEAFAVSWLRMYTNSCGCK